MKDRLKKLSQVPLTILDGDRGVNYPNKSEFQEAGFCLFLNTSNVTKAGFDFSSTDFVSKERDTLLRKGKLRRGDVVMTTRGTIGNVAYYGDHVSYEHIRINSGMVILRAEAKKLDPYFLYSFLRSDLFKKQTRSQGSGSAQPQLPIGSLRNIVIPQLDFADQQDIGKVLSTLDAKIELNNRINEELEGLAKLLYDYWFVQFDFPITAAQAAAMGKPHLKGKPYRASGGKMTYNEALKREIPDGWEGENILAISEIGGGATPSKKTPEFWGGAIPFFTPTDAESEPFSLDTEDHITQLGLGNSATRLYPKGTLFITARGSVGKAMIISKPMAMSQSCYALCPHDGVGSAFLYFHTLSLMDYLHAKSSGSIFKSIVTNDINFTPAIVPASQSLTAFNEAAEPMFKSILTHQEYNQQLTELRDWLLPMLMNGQVTVS